MRSNKQGTKSKTLGRKLTIFVQMENSGKWRKGCSLDQERPTETNRIGRSQLFKVAGVGQLEHSRLEQPT